MGSDPPPVADHQILPYIDGFNHVARIAALADVEPNLVRACAHNLVYHRVVSLVPIFQYCNVYTVTPELDVLRNDKKLREDLLNTISKKPGSPPNFRDVYSFIAGFTYGVTVKELCIQHNPAKAGFDERRLVQYLVLRGILRRVHKYPAIASHKAIQDPETSGLYCWFDGGHNTDEISVRTGLSSARLDTIIEADPSLIVLCK